jgi:hypothetical protein
VVWAPEPLILACILLMLVVDIWMSQFSRNRGELTELVALLNMLRMLMFYFAAGFCLPDPEPSEATIDLGAYYERTKRFTYGSLVAGLLVFWVYNSVLAPTGWRADLIGKAAPIAIWVALMFSRWRWLNLLLLAFPVVGVASDLAQGSLGLGH